MAMRQIKDVEVEGSYGVILAVLGQLLLLMAVFHGWQVYFCAGTPGKPTLCAQQLFYHQAF